MSPSKLTLNFALSTFAVVKECIIPSLYEMHASHCIVIPLHHIKINEILFSHLMFYNAQYFVALEH